jgi:hypothetical protein
MGTPVNAASFILNPNLSATSPPFFQPDNTACFGTIGNLSNLNEIIFGDIVAVAIGTSVTPTLLATQLLAGVIDVGGSPAGAVTLTTPTALQIIAQQPPTIDRIGGYSFQCDIINDNTTQTITLTAGVGVTILGNATIATNTNRSFMVNCNVTLGTVTILNIGTSSL